MIRATIAALFLAASPQSSSYDGVPPSSLELAGGTMAGDINHAGNDLVCSPLTSDAAPSDLAAQACGAYPLATVNTTGGDINLAGGHGSKSITVDDYTNCGTDTVTVTVVDSDGAATANVLTEASEWTAATDNATTCASLAAAVGALAGVSATSCTAAKFGVTADAGTLRVTLAEGDATCTTVANGSDGEIEAISPITGAGSLAGYLLLGQDGFDAGYTEGAVASDAGDVLVRDDLEVMGTIQAYENIYLWQNNFLRFGANTSGAYAIADTVRGQFIWDLDSAGVGHQFVFSSERGKDYDHAADTDLAVYVQGVTDPDSDNTQWLKLQFNSASDYAVLGSGSGAFNLTGQTALNGASSTLTMATEDLTFAASPGDASKTTSGLIPDGAVLRGVTTRWTTAATNCTSVSIGDGSDVDLFGATTGITQGTTTDNSDATAAFANPQLAATEITVTANGGNCFDGVIKIVAYYETFTAPTSN